MTDTHQDSGFAARGTLDRNRDVSLTPELVVRRLINEGFSQGHLDVCDEIIADEIVEHQDYGPGHAPGAAGVKAVVVSLRCAFSDFKLEIEDMVVAGDMVRTRNVATGTNDGPYMGHPPAQTLAFHIPFRPRAVSVSGSRSPEERSPRRGAQRSCRRA